MKSHLRDLLHQALRRLHAQGVLPEAGYEIGVERAQEAQHGDYASNIALALAKPARRKPRELAQLIVAQLPASTRVAKVEIAGPGFINFFVSAAALQSVVSDILQAGDGYGRSALGAGQKIQVEFVSANPNGPLHVGHGRGAAIGSTLANLLQATGYEVQREYYVNDAGRQMDILALSVWLRYLEQCGERVTFPVNGYKGDYVRHIARALHEKHGAALRRDAREVWRGVPPDEGVENGDKEAHVDALIARARSLLGAADYRTLFEAGLNAMLADIRDDLEQFGVHYDHWFSERSLTTDGAVGWGSIRPDRLVRGECLQKLAERGSVASAAENRECSRWQMSPRR